MKKIYMVTSPKGGGKSTAIARFPRPSEIHQMCVVDTEDSMSNILENNERMNVEFGKYIRMYERLSKDVRSSILESMARGELPWVDQSVKASALVDFYHYFLDTVSTVLANARKRGQPFKFLGLDTVEPLEAAVKAYVVQNRGKAGWSGSWAWGAPETEGVRPILEGIFEGFAELGVEHIIISSHLKPVWEGDGKKARRIQNKVKIGGRLAVWARTSSQMWWLVPGVGNSDGAPAALRLKARFAHEEIDTENDEWITREMLPGRIPHFTWKDVRRYQEQGWNPESPRPGEIPTEKEMQMMSEFLTDEQMKLMVIGAQSDLLEKQQAVGGVFVQPNAKPIDVLAKAGGDLEKAIEMINAQGSNANIVRETGLSLRKVIELRREQVGEK